MAEDYTPFNKKRTCLSCERELSWGIFATTVLTYTEGEERKIFNLSMLEEIWVNPIFVLVCCFCFNGVTVGEL